MADLVSVHIARWRREPFVWGESDCMLSIADYLADALCRDAAGRFRGRYTTKRGCMRVSGFHRDPVRPMAECVAEYPLAQTDSPRRGDVGVIDAGGEIVGAICLGDFWAGRAERGLAIGKPTRVLAAWRVPTI